MSQPWDLSSLPGKVTDVNTILNRDQEEESIHDEGPLIHVSPHGGVGCLDHYIQ